MKRIARVFEYTLLVLTVAIAACGLIAFLSLSPLLKDASGWMQAIGSVIAIFGAYHLSDLSHRREQQAQQRIAILDEVRRLEIVIAVLSRLVAAANVALAASQANDHEAVLDIQSTDFAQQQESLSSIPLLEVPDAGVAVRLTNAHAYIDKVVRVRSSVGEDTATDCYDKYEELIGNGYEEALDALIEFLNESINFCAVVARARKVKADAMSDYHD